MTRPAVPPYSSITMAMWNFSSCISRKSEETSLDSGMNLAGRAHRRTGWSALPTRSARTRSLVYEMPITSSMPSSCTGMRL